jgi:hypothetical protein
VTRGAAQDADSALDVRNYGTLHDPPAREASCSNRGYPDLNNTDSTIQWQNQTYHLEAPALDIQYYSQQNASVFLYGDKVLDAKYIRENGICKPEQGYQWGFPSFLLITFLVVSWVLSILLHIGWLDSFRYKHHDQVVVASVVCGRRCKSLG